MSTHWFTSDLHFGHEKVADLRGYATVAEHDNSIVENWADSVRPTDCVWVLGDLAMADPTYALTLLASMPGAKHLIVGNHDPAHPMHRDAHKWQKRYLTVFESVQAFARRRIRKQQVLLSHFPYSEDHTATARYMPYRLRDEGMWLLHGHTHNPSRGNGRQVHVGLDAWNHRPVALHEVEAEMAARGAFS